MSANPDFTIEIKTSGGSMIVRVHTGRLDLADLRKLQGCLNNVITMLDPPERQKRSLKAGAGAAGGRARAAAMTPEARSDFARKAANARWKPASGPLT